MAVLVCSTSAQPIELGKCFVQPNLSRPDQEALETYLWILMADTIIGTTHTSDIPAFSILARTYACAMSDEQLRVSFIGILNQPITTGDPGPFAADKTSLSLAQAVEAIKCLRNYNSRQIAEMKALAQCYFFGGLGF